MPTLIVLLSLLWPTMLLAQAGTFRQSTPITDGYVGSPLLVGIVFLNARDWTLPALPQVDGLRIQRLDPPDRRRTVHEVGGQVSESFKVTYTFVVTASSAGDYVIPAFPIVVDGNTFSSSPIPLTFRKANTNGLLSVEVMGDPDQIYQGESTLLTIQVLIKQYTNRQFNLTPDSRDMWKQIDINSDWGPFAETMREMDSSRRPPRGRVQTLRGEDGLTAAHYLYQIQTQVRPTLTGPLDLSNIRISLNYPLSIRRDPGFFGSAYRIDQTLSVVAEAVSRGIEVLPLPEKDRPVTFHGAIGEFAIHTSAAPTTVAVGDPITLTVIVTDRGPKAIDMDMVPAPELDRVEALDAEFRVPHESLPGHVRGRTKTFTQTIRARTDAVESIPPIPYSFFNPRTGTYETATSTPILLDVSPAETITSSDIQGVGARVTSTDELHGVAGGLLANYTGSQRLLADQGPPNSWWLLGLLIVPPILVLGITGTRVGVRGRLADPARIRSRRAGRTALTRLDHASSSGDAATIGTTLCTYVADRVGQPTAGFMRGDAVAALQASGVGPDLIKAFDALIGRCEQLQYAGGSADLQSMLESARSAIRQLDATMLTSGVNA